MNEADSVHEAMSPAEIESSVRALCEGEPSLIARLANAASVIFNGMPDLNWAGFYLFDGRELGLGPFQGRPACTRIALTRGVCGKAGTERRTVVVDDVHAFPGHIACDARSRSEIVVPLVGDGGERPLYGVLDIDSPRVSRFGEEERRLMESVVAIVVAGVVPDWKIALTA
jgi:GAF domain-containing protein